MSVHAIRELLYPLYTRLLAKAERRVLRDRKGGCHPAGLSAILQQVTGIMIAMLMRINQH